MVRVSVPAGAVDDVGEATGVLVAAGAAGDGEGERDRLSRRPGRSVADAVQNDLAVVQIERGHHLGRQGRGAGADDRQTVPPRPAGLPSRVIRSELTI